MKKTQKGFVISSIHIGKDGFIEVKNKDGEVLKTTRVQRECISRYANKRERLISEIKRTFNNDKIIDDSVVITKE